MYTSSGSIGFIALSCTTDFKNKKCLGWLVHAGTHAPECSLALSDSDLPNSARNVASSFRTMPLDRHLYDVVEPNCCLCPITPEAKSYVWEPTTVVGFVVAAAISSLH